VAIRTARIRYIHTIKDVFLGKICDAEPNVSRRCVDTGCSDIVSITNDNVAAFKRCNVIASMPQLSMLIITIATLIIDYLLT